MNFSHDDSIWTTHSPLAAGALWVERVTPQTRFDDQIAALHAAARDRLAQRAEGEFPEIQAWRRAFSAMGLKPTQYRCAAESLLRRFRKEGTLPALHPLVDVCNAASLAFAIPVAAFDLAHIDGNLAVRKAIGSETYESFAGDQERPDPGEVIFVDTSGHAHARRWCHRQSRRSTIHDGTTGALIVAEAMHSGGATTVERLLTDLTATLTGAGWSVEAGRMLQRQTPRFDLNAKPG